jgi:RNA-dependent RNA polymerase
MGKIHVYKYTSNTLYAKASAWYHVTYHPEYWGVYNEGYDHRTHHLISFPWCVYDKLLRIKQRKNLLRKLRQPDMSALQNSMSRHTNVRLSATISLLL